MSKVLVAVATTIFVAVVLAVLWQVGRILLFAFGGILLAVFLRGSANWVAARTPLRPAPAVGLICVALLAMTVGVGSMLAGQVAEQLEIFVREVPRAIEQIRNTLEQYALGRYIIELIPTVPERLMGADIDVWSWLGDLVTRTLGSVVEFLLLIFVGLALALSPAPYIEGVVRLMPRSIRPRTREVLATLNEQLTYWLYARLLTMVIVGLLVALGLWLLDIPLVLTLGLIAGILEFVPFVGPIISSIPAILLALLHSPLMALYVGLFFWGVQSAESYLITPILHQKIVSLPPALVIIAELVMAIWGGVIGLILATPLLVVIVVLVKLIYMEDILGDQISLNHE